MSTERKGKKGKGDDNAEEIGRERGWTRYYKERGRGKEGE